MGTRKELSGVFPQQKEEENPRPEKTFVEGHGPDESIGYRGKGKKNKTAPDRSKIIERDGRKKGGTSLREKRTFHPKER